MKARGSGMASLWQALGYLFFLIAGLLELWLQWNRNFDPFTYWAIGDDLVLMIAPVAGVASVLAVFGRDATLKLLAGGFVVVAVLQFFGMYHDWTSSETDGLYGFIDGFDTAWGIMCVVAWPLTRLGREGRVSEWTISRGVPALLVVASVTLANAWRPQRQAFDWPAPPPWRLQEYQLAEAVHMGDLARVRTLVKDDGARLDAEDAAGWTPLLFAVDSGQEAVVRELLDRGADPDSREYVYGRRAPYRDIPREPGLTNGTTALMIAAVRGHAGIAKMLLDAGADARLENQNGSTALELALAAGQAEVVALLR